MIKLNILDIVPYANNPRKNHNVEEVKDSIKEFGYLSPVVVDENNVILAGHTRYFALKELGYQFIEVKQITNLSESKKKAFRILDNKLNDLGSWDTSLLETELNLITNKNAINEAFSEEEIRDIAKTNKTVPVIENPLVQSYEKMKENKQDKKIVEEYLAKKETTELCCPYCYFKFIHKL
jgi:hypothetical protein